MSYYSAGREDQIESRRLAFNRARSARRERRSSWPSFNEDPAFSGGLSNKFNLFDDKFSGVMSQSTSAMDAVKEKSLEDWQKAYESDEHKDALAYQAKGFKLQEDSYKIAKEAQEEAAKRAQRRQRTSGALGFLSRAASFIPGVGPLVSTAIDTAREFV